MWWISLTLFLLVLFSVGALRFVPSKAKNRFRMDFLYQLLLYIFEIWLMFSLFQWVLSSYADTLGYSEEGTLKRFIDFFTVYQIFIFVVLKLYDSLKIDAYTSLLVLINKALPHIDEKEVLPDGFVDESNFEIYQKLIISSDADNMRTSVFDLLKEYDCLLDGDCMRETVLNLFREEKDFFDGEKLDFDDFYDAYIRMRMHSIKHQFHEIKSTLEHSREELNFHWNVSLFQRIFKWGIK